MNTNIRLFSNSIYVEVIKPLYSEVGSPFDPEVEVPHRTHAPA
jgi:hypothetical protein